jgi:hypothetical protein
MESRHRDFSLELAGSTIKISSNFDSGNLENAQLIDGKVTLTPAFDPMNAQYSLKQSSKTFFHFSIQASSEIDLPLVIRHMKILQYFSSVLMSSCRISNFSNIIASAWGANRRKGGPKQFSTKNNNCKV